MPPPLGDTSSAASPLQAAALLSEAEALLDDDAAQGGAADELGAPSADCGGFGQAHRLGRTVGPLSAR